MTFKTPKFSGIRSWSLPKGYHVGGGTGRCYAPSWSYVFFLPFSKHEGFPMKTDVMPKGHKHTKWKCQGGIFILNAWTATNMKRFWTWHFNGPGMNFPFMCVSKKRAMSLWLIDEHEKVAFQIILPEFFISAKKCNKSRAWTEPDRNYLPVEKSHTIRELFSIPVFPGDLWRNNP